ncbi:mitofusin-2-like [Paramacrobiotus metropolitanus]|uniref:mitofusin-2-like n=1 Tax=Paramacrobiotus metropolitanus TaxID=2943436 RepID=UPI00244609F5|nr:mitofusin-2-like [Paramacrobiotus metropolitanus]
MNGQKKTMSAYIHRSQSHMDSPTAKYSDTADDDEMAVFDGEGRIGDQNGLGKVSNPLKIFRAAKKKIGDIFKELDDHMKQSSAFFNRIKNGGVIPDDVAVTNDVDENCEKIRGILDVVSRDHMKVVFFGRTSNGKSSVINAMLRDRILPTGIGHTTNCFIQVEGIDGEEPYALVEGSNQRYNVTSIKSLSHALSAEHLSEQTLVKLMWPKSKCYLLQEDVVLVDSPGIDVTANTDSWIDKYCTDADVFVLVANAESTLMQTEKNFFHKVSTKLSQPHVFILNNRWDASANEPETMDDVRKQHLSRNLEFLTEELKGISKQQAIERVYFVSAKEVLTTAMKKQKNEEVNTANFADGYLMRMHDFETFERKFQQCISKSAVRTKFEQHTVQGRKIARVIRSQLELVYDRANSRRASREEERLRQEAVFQMKTTHYEALIVEFKEKIDLLSRKAGQEVIAGFREELGKLPTTVNSYSRNWPLTNEQMEIYKAGLYETFERNLLRNFEARCSVPVNNAVDLLHREMLNRLGALLPDQSRDVLLAPLHRRHRFNLRVHFGIPEMCVGFHEDLTFRFSLGWDRLARLVLNRNEVRKLTFFGFLPARQIEPPPVPAGYPKSAEVGTTVRDVVMPKSAPAALPTQPTERNLDLVEIAAILSKCGVGTGAVVFMVWRSIGWRVIAGAAATYGLLYGAERLAWHFRTRRRVFKQQFIDFVKPQLASLIHPTANSTTCQVQEELTYNYQELLRMVNESTMELSERIAALRKEVRSLDDVTSQADSLKRTSADVEMKLQNFLDSFIAPQQLQSGEDLTRPNEEFWAT